MLKCFFNEHPFISLLMVATVCETAVVMTKIIKGNNKHVTIGIFGDEADDEEDVSNKETTETKED